MRTDPLPTVAVFGGSFNPVHEGHLAIVRALAADPEVQRVLVVPAHRSPFKGAGAPLPAALRWEMLRRALAGLPRVALSDVELHRPPPSYTVDTLHALAAWLPGARLMFALGWDAFAEFRGWYRAAEILSLAGLVVFDRADSPDGAGGSRVGGTGAASTADGRRDPVPEPSEWAALLPPPWVGRALPADGQHLVTREGRVLVRHMPLALPPVAAREILAQRSLEGVPAGAREVLAGYWQRTQPG
jgi:nicotinate (nicotinamide) nucleotide adenylyltransferase